MSSFFEDLNDLLTETSTGKVVLVILAIWIFAFSVAMGLAYLITYKH